MSLIIPSTLILDFSKHIKRYVILYQLLCLSCPFFRPPFLLPPSLPPFLPSFPPSCLPAFLRSSLTFFLHLSSFSPSHPSCLPKILLHIFPPFLTSFPLLSLSSFLPFSFLFLSFSISLFLIVSSFRSCMITLKGVWEGTWRPVAPALKCKWLHRHTRKWQVGPWDATCFGNFLV